uniref:Ankyrin repeat and zinc finger peptidyl tRNA hydrolase 1 n=1 Tax=Electrophorus electricus TaxID=8005 RepID=A0A4W4H8C1_ELEEL
MYGKYDVCRQGQVKALVRVGCSSRPHVLAQFQLLHVLSLFTQMEHYKLDWHRFNLKQRLAGRPPFTVEEFEKKTGAGDMSSISGSDSEDDESDSPEGEEVTCEGRDSSRLSSRVVLQNSEGQYMSLYRRAVQSSRVSEVNLVDSLLKVSDKTVWLILMTGGGHFAGAVFQGKEVLQHKTFHRYTVRAKRGTAQGLRDAQNRGHTPKSAGAALRLLLLFLPCSIFFSMNAVFHDIQDLLKSWSDYLSVASGIFLRAPKYNRSVFFGGRGAPLEIKDKRICSLPFATRRATFSEVKRVHDVLSTIQIYDKNVDISSILSPLKRVWQRKSRNPPNPITQTHSNVEEDEQSSEDEGSVQLEMVEVTLGTLDLREHEVKPNKKKRRKRRERKTTEREGELLLTSDLSHWQNSASFSRIEGTAVVCEWWEYGLRDALYTACKTGDSETLCTLLQGEEITALHLNTPVDSAGFTLLHVASAAGHKATIRLLLDAGSDPACRDRKGQTPYGVSPDKDTRNTFRKYMAEQPDKYDYTKAQVPGPLTAEIESKKAEKKKAQKVLRRRREREQKEERRRREEEEEERTRFLELSDTEKVVLRSLPSVLMSRCVFMCVCVCFRRCWQCGASLLGKVPFEYLHFSFCTTRCVQAHRRANAAPKP